MSKEEKYISLFIDPIKKSVLYQPKFGTGNRQGVSYSEFAQLYASDPFYSWIGLGTKLMYAAHKAAGGMTSIYRQIGVGCESLFREIIHDQAQYTDKAFATWSYQAQSSLGTPKVLKLDARIERKQIRNEIFKERFENWLDIYCQTIFDVPVPPNGVVFEVRQGYKSKDSKRQNADIDNATVAWSYGYLPIFAVFSSQIDPDIVARYRNNRCGILIGVLGESNQISTFSFFEEVVGFDLSGFFARNSDIFKKEIESILEGLLDKD